MNIEVGIQREVFVVRAKLPEGMLLAVKLQNDTMEANLTSWWRATVAALSTVKGQGIFIVQEFDNLKTLRVVKREAASFLTGALSFATTTVLGRESILAGNVVVFPEKEMNNRFVDISIHNSVAQINLALKSLR